MRSLDDLVDVHEPAWPMVAGWFDACRNPVSVLLRDAASAEATLVHLQVTTRSPMGAMAFETGGAVIADGLVRLLGGGSERLQGLAAWNPLPPQVPGACIVAHDAVGGVFAINGGGLVGDPGDVAYFAPDTLEWESLERSYSDFLRFLADGDLAGFYASMLWTSAAAAIEALHPDQVLSQYPPLWTAEGKDLEGASRSPTPAATHFTSQLHLRAQLAPAGPSSN